MPLFPRTDEYLEDKIEPLRDLHHPSTYRPKTGVFSWKTTFLRLFLFLALVFITFSLLDLALR